MADLILSPALQVIFDRLASPVIQKFADMWDLQENLQSLEHALKLVQPTLEDAEEQQLSNKAVRFWLSKLKIEVSEAEDLLDFYTVRETCPHISSELIKGTNPGQIRKSVQALKKTINEGLSMFNFKELSRVDGRSSKRETSSVITEPEIYGREDDKEKLVKLLLSSEANQEGYAICIPIIGIGGIGKTTLAQLAYNDKRVDQHFDVRMWTFVSQDFNLKKIMKTIVESATKAECKFSEIGLLQSEVWDLLHNKRYLLVLDDVWTEDQDDWDKLRSLFRGSVDGCKVILTTRSKKIAKMMGAPNSPIPYDLKGLAEDDCWALFKHRAFAPKEEEKYPSLLLIGKQIVRKCGGVPLAAKSLGSLMHIKRDEQLWLVMQNSDLWKLDESQQRVLPALMLSYLHLPPHLRRCFAFFSVFPKNYEFKKQKLIYLWMAEGLILAEGNKKPEDIGNEYFDDLLWMSFFKEVELCDGGGIIGYTINDMIHELACYVAGNEYLVLENGVPLNCTTTQIHRTSVVYTYGAITIPEALYDAKHLRTLLLLGDSGLLGKTHKPFSSFKFMRVLDMNSCDVSDHLLESLGSLICLRYLDLSNTPISMLPLNTRYLCSLQFVNLFGCHNLKSLPAMDKMTNLRHLILTGCESLTEMPCGLENLHQLQTLPLYVVRPYTIHNCKVHIEELRGSTERRAEMRVELEQLRRLNIYGKLNITHLENLDYKEQADSTGLMMKENLESLGLYWGSEEFEYESFRKLPKARPKAVASGSHIALRVHFDPVEEILEAFQPHKNLRKLVIHGYPGIRFPQWALPNLTSVCFTNCKNCELLPALGNLPLLKTLSLHGMDGVKHIGTEFYGDGTDTWFSSLEELSLDEFSNLEDWSNPNDKNAFPILRKLVVRRCPKLVRLPLPQSLQHLELRDCNATLMSIPNLTLLAVLVLEKIPELSCLPEGLRASTRLSSLKILSCPKLRSLPSEMENLTALKSLTIRWSEELSSLPQSMQNLKALESLEISDCHCIISMPDGGIGGLCSLRTLSIENCSNLTSLSSSLEQLRLLEHLTIMYCPNLGSFPEGVQHLSALRSLIILSCPWFDSLPEGLQNIKTLHCLEISSCPNLTALPEWFEDLDSLRSLTISDCTNLKLLPPGFNLLTKLQHLSIQECPELEERCRQGSGEDWFKIAHVPHKYIGSPQVRQSCEASTLGSSSVQISSQ